MQRPAETWSRSAESEAYRDIQRTEAGLQRTAEAWSRPADTCRDLDPASKDLQIPVETKRRPTET